eukprot:SAG31_NODE_2159_length_6302_cov_9.311140_10_plen_182_part_00
MRWYVNRRTQRQNWFTCKSWTRTATDLRPILAQLTCASVARLVLCRSCAAAAVQVRCPRNRLRQPAIAAHRRNCLQDRGCGICQPAERGIRVIHYGTTAAWQHCVCNFTSLLAIWKATTSRHWAATGLPWDGSKHFAVAHGARRVALPVCCASQRVATSLKQCRQTTESSQKSLRNAHRDE